MNETLKDIERRGMSENKELYLNFDEYIRQGELAKRERAELLRDMKDNNHFGNI